MQRKVKLFITSSLDCYIARGDGSVDWLFTDGDYGHAEFYDSTDTVMMGRKTYETALKFEEQPYRDRRCCVFTRNPLLGEKYQAWSLSLTLSALQRAWDALGEKTSGLSEGSR